MDRYSFDVENFHLLSHAGLSRRSEWVASLAQPRLAQGPRLATFDQKPAGERSLAGAQRSQRATHNDVASDSSTLHRRRSPLGLIAAIQLRVSVLTNFFFRTPTSMPVQSVTGVPDLSCAQHPGSRIPARPPKQWARFTAQPRSSARTGATPEAPQSSPGMPWRCWGGALVTPTVSTCSLTTVPFTPAREPTMPITPTGRGRPE